MTDPAAVTYYYEGELPAHHSFAGDFAMEESFDLERQFSLSNPQHVARADALVAAGILSKTPPKKTSKE